MEQQNVHAIENTQDYILLTLLFTVTSRALSYQPDGKANGIM